jgi:hypothetical protein
VNVEYIINDLGRKEGCQGRRCVRKLREDGDEEKREEDGKFQQRGFY